MIFLEHWQRALGAYQGHYLAELTADGPWLTIERERSADLNTIDQAQQKSNQNFEHRCESVSNQVDHGVKRG